MSLSPKDKSRHDKRDATGVDAQGRAARTESAKATLRREFRAWRASPPAGLARDTLLWPEAVADSVITEASRYLNAELPADFSDRLAVKAHRLYTRHRQFRQIMRRGGNRGRDALWMFMRHWMGSWLKRERRFLFKQLPWEYALGVRPER